LIHWFVHTTFITFFALLSCAQNKETVPVNEDLIVNFDIHVKDTSGNNMEGVELKLFRDDDLHFVTKSNSKGKFSENLTLHYGFVYHMEFRKRRYIRKTVEIDMKANFSEEDVEEEVIIPMDIELFKKKWFSDYKLIEDNPVGRFHLNPNTGLIDVDREYSVKRKKEIDNFLNNR